jgi:scyllo-inositol 2-dehydrogenase (NADP+)
MSSPIRVGLVGYGLAGSVFHAPLIRTCGRMELSAVLTSREAPARVDSLDELIERSDLVVIASLNRTHFPIASWALRAG